MIKVTYETIEDNKKSLLKKPEETTIRILKGRYFASYNIGGKAEATVKQMMKDGRTGVIYSRGMMIQNFPNKDEEEILKIVQEDIENGLRVAQTKTKKKLKIQNLFIKRT